MSFSNAKEEKMYVAVSNDMKENTTLLSWAFNNSGGLNLCLIHVHKFSTKIVNLSRKKEQEAMSVALDEYLRNSQKPGVRVEKLYIEAFSIKEGIIQLIQQHCIRKLVIGAASEKLYSRRMTLKSKKAVYVNDNAPSFCHIWFICNGRLIHTREAINPPKLSPGKNALVTAERYGAGSRTVPGDLSLSCSSIGNNRGSSSRSGSMREFATGRLSQSSSMFMLRNESESSVIDHPCAKLLERDLLKAENSCQVAFGESPRCQIAEIKAEMAERLYKEELKLRKAKEEDLAKEKEEHKITKDLWNETSNELHMITAQKFSLENLLEKSNLSLKESEKKLLSAVESLQKYKNELEELHMERNNAVEEAEMLREHLSRRPSCSNLPLFFSVFSLADLEEATNFFDPCLKIGEGGYGNIYLGVLCHTEVAIHKLHHNSTLGRQEFIQEVEVLSKLRHPNLVTLVGACPESQALVYEYLPGGSLEDRLICRDNAVPLPWQTRIRIATELCSALIFLHSNQLGCFIHGDLKPSNVLSANCVCKLDNFGICHVASKTNASMDQTNTYMDPEFLSTEELTPKSDVYSFGIILLRLLTGKSALGIAEEVEYALAKGTLDSVLDPSAGDWPFVQAEQLAHTALRCCDMNRENRPDLGSDVWRVLEPMKVSCQSSSVHRPVSDDQAPNYFMCPILQDIMEDPHVASDGFTYEAEAIRGWLDSGHYTSPMTNVTLANHILTPNRALRSTIQEWLIRNPSV
ncbi:hypothetical protein RND81_03G211200 [Saponaria officinalis]|uniref:RING-type E3 ubiquitin transferase n=1 Tax=Saponaria officinalis TaxID=3572 RepID=A0AAW1M946_SAPOF